MIKTVQEENRKVKKLVITLLMMLYKQEERKEFVITDCSRSKKKKKKKDRTGQDRELVSVLMEMWWDAKTDQRRRMREEEEWKWKQQIVRKKQPAVTTKVKILIFLSRSSEVAFHIRPVNSSTMVSTTYTQAHTHVTVY